MTAAMYQELALGWKPGSKRDLFFNIFAIIVIAALLATGIYLSTIELPKEERKARAAVPERIAKFVMQKPKPKPKPKPVQKKPTPKPQVKKIVKKPEATKKPLTKSQKVARKKAENTGLLALGNELADLMDTSDISAMVAGDVKKSSAASRQAARVNKDVLTANASKGSGGVDAKQYATTVSKTTQLSGRQVTQVKQSLLATRKAEDKSRTKRSRSSGVRAEEDITIVFDQNKSKLYSIYNRARRKNPGLKGKIVLEITIAASGKVTAIKILSSELNDASLEKRLLSRIKLFNFGAQKVEAVTVTYPIEFLPS